MGKLNEIHEVEIVYKRPTIALMETVKCADDSIELFRKFIPEEKIDFKEFFLVALLSRNNHVLGVSTISVGSTNGTCVNVKEIFQLAIKTNSSSIILCHNHPSGNLTPSESDIAITKKIKAACGLCDIVLLDHIILTKEGHNSFIDEV
ncbi:MAG: DNA repair protein [Odoribacter sp.]|nr:DNA repair protein [Odoribacter sp.]